MGAPIRSSAEIATILNKGKNAIGDIGYDVMEDAKRGLDFTEVEFRDKAYRLIFLRSFLKNLIAIETGELRAYYTASGNEKKLNIMLDALVQLCGTLGGPNSIPLIQSRRIPVVFYPSASGPSSGGGGTGGPANPGGVTFQNLDVDAPGEVVDQWDASSSNFAFYVVNVRGANFGEGSRLDIITVNLRDGNTPVITNYRGNDIGGSTAGVTYSAAINGPNLELTCNVPTDDWSVQGVRISFQNISFQNTIGPLPTGGTAGQYLRKTSSTDFDAAFASILISEISGLSTALAGLLSLTGGTMSGAIAMGGNKITGAGAATVNGDLVRYEQIFGAFLALAGGVMSGNIAMGGNKVTGAGAASGNGELVRYEQLFGAFLSLVGGTMAGNVAMGGNKITGAGAASTNGDLIRYEQLFGAFLALTGGTMSGALAMGSHKITGVTAGSTTGDAATFEQLPTNGAWTAVALINGWTGTVYYRQEFGCVRLRGTLSAAGASAASWTGSGSLPNAISSNAQFAVPGSATANKMLRLNVTSSGSGGMSGYAAGDTDIPVDGVCYPTT